MEGKENILEELKQISAFVAGISRVTPYGLPEGYFEDLASKVLVRIRAGEGLRNFGADNPPFLPYRTDQHTDNIGPELPASLSTDPVYSVPTGYFEGFAEK